jgi:hypothetical protein
MILILYKRSIASVIACAALAALAVEGAVSPTPAVNVPPQPPPTAMTTDFVRVTAPWIAIPIESAPLICEVGKRVMLIQENDDFFITMCSNGYEGVFLAAFPVNSREGRLAWTTPDQKVFFAYRTSSCSGKMYFRQGDELPVDAETRSDYKLRLERFDCAFPLYLSKKSGGIEFVKAPPPAPAQIAATKTAPKSAPASTRKTPIAPARKTTPASTSRPPPAKRYVVAPAGPSTNLLATSPAAQKPLTTTPEKKEAVVAKAESVQKSEPPVTAGAATNKAMAAASASTNSQTVAAKKMPRTGTRGLMSEARKYRIFILISASLVLLVFGLYGESRRRRKTRLRGVAMKAAAEAPAAGVDGSGEPPPIPGASNDFSGSIASMSLGSVTQLLNSHKETGTLLVKDKSNAEIGTLVFVKGEIVDAKSPDKRGIDALYGILRNKEGFFSFLRKEPENVEKTITQGIISLLLDAHRIMDEEHVSPILAPPATPRAATKFKLHGNH